MFCNQYHIRHRILRPRTPWHNGKVEGSHRNDQEQFYNYLKFYSFDDLQVQMKRYLYRSNNIPMAVLGWKSPNQKQRELSGFLTAAKWDSFSRRYAPRSFIPFCILLVFSCFLFFYFFSLTSLTNVQTNSKLVKIAITLQH